MSASSKKKLRNEQAAEKLTERQQAEQKEAKKLKTYTIIFSAVVAVMLVFALATLGYRAVLSSGVLTRNSTAVTVDEHNISGAEMNYFYIDYIYKYYEQNNSYLPYFLDFNTPLDQQTYFGSADGQTWADFFVSGAKESAASVYALNDAAKAEGFTLSEEDIATLDKTLNEDLPAIASQQNFNNAASYLKAMYGNGATLASYRAYLEMSLLADAYQAAHQESLTYDDADLRAAEAENYDLFSNFSYNVYYVSADKFLKGGTANEDGTTTYTEDEKNLALGLAEGAANALISEEIVSLEDLDAAIAAMGINADAEAEVTSNAFDNYSYNSIDSTYRSWICDDSRKEGDKGVFAYVTGAEGSEVTNGYYVVYFKKANDNNFALANVRHILIQPEGGTYNPSTGNYSYTQESLDAAEAKANQLLADWKAGEATSDSFGVLANEHSADGDGTTGGLYTDVIPGQMVEAFNDWCFDDTRVAGDTGVILTGYGYHVMYYVGDSETIYRDLLIENSLLNEDMNEWYNALISEVTATLVSDKYIRTGLMLNMLFG